jgi:hypothetical protein
MAKRSRMTIQKRQRELKRAEKAARKRAKRHGQVIEAPAEPTPTLDMGELFGQRPSTEDESSQSSNDREVEQQEDDKA